MFMSMSIFMSISMSMLMAIIMLTSKSMSMSKYAINPYLWVFLITHIILFNPYPNRTLYVDVLMIWYWNKYIYIVNSMSIFMSISMSNFNVDVNIIPQKFSRTPYMNSY